MSARKPLKDGVRITSFFVKCTKCGNYIKGCNISYLTKSAAEKAIRQLPKNMQDCSAGGKCVPVVVESSTDAGSDY